MSTVELPPMDTSIHADEILRRVSEPELELLPPEHAERNVRIEDEYGDQARTLLLEEGRRLSVAEHSMQFRGGQTVAKGILNFFLHHPDSWVPVNRFNNTSFRGSPVSSLQAFNRGFVLPVIELQQNGRGKPSPARLAADLRVVDKRTEVPEPPISRSKKLTPEALDDYRRATKRQVRFEILYPVNPEPPLINNIDLVHRKYPDRIVKINNLAQINNRTAALLDYKARKYPDRPAPQPNQLVIIDDTRAVFNGQEFETGPFANRILNALLASYLNAKVDVQTLAVSDEKSVKGDLQSFIRSLATRGMISLEGSAQRVEAISLKPILIDDLRQA